ncbi:hypothetical protein [Streptomyces sp. NPDC005017]|uniref:hypothetical protein n=1 Tax=Streptomyces sp. NPDC005017 TaxID=3364706 RepID=UPI0036914893
MVATTQVPLLGQLSASAHVGVAGPRAIGVNDVRLSDNVPPAARTLLEKALERQAPLDNLPEGLALQSVAVTDHGIVALMTGRPRPAGPACAAPAGPSASRRCRRAGRPCSTPAGRGRLSGPGIDDTTSREGERTSWPRGGRRTGRDHSSRSSRPRSVVRGCSVQMVFPLRV